MMSCPAASKPQTDAVFKTLLRRRSRPYVVIFDCDSNVLYAEPHALRLRARAHVSEAEKQAGELMLSARGNDAAGEEILGPIDGLILRVVPLSGSCGAMYAIFFEEEARREDLRQAVSRFSFTPREIEILDRILSGMNAAEIAEDLHIAEVTVFDHFKHISYKTKARNRADMLAKIFNWQPALKSRSAAKYGVDRRSGSQDVPRIR